MRKVFIVIATVLALTFAFNINVFAKSQKAEKSIVFLGVFKGSCSDYLPEGSKNRIIYENIFVLTETTGVGYTSLPTAIANIVAKNAREAGSISIKKCRKIKGAHFAAVDHYEVSTSPYGEYGNYLVTITFQVLCFK